VLQPKKRILCSCSKTYCSITGKNGLIDWLFFSRYLLLYFTANAEIIQAFCGVLTYCNKSVDCCEVMSVYHALSDA